MKEYNKPTVSIYSGIRDYLLKVVCRDCKIAAESSHFSCPDFIWRFIDFGKQMERFV